MKKKEINAIKLKLWIYFSTTIFILVIIGELLWITMDIWYLWIIIFISVIYIIIVTYEMSKIYNFNMFFHIAKILLFTAFFYVSIILLWESFNNELDSILPLSLMYYIPSLIITFFSLFNKDKFTILIILILLFPFYYLFVLFNSTPFHLF